MPSALKARQKDSPAIRKQFGVTIQIGNLALEFKRQPLNSLIAGHVQFLRTPVARRTHSPLKTITRSPKARETFHVHCRDAGWQSTQQRFFSQKSPSGFHSVDQNNVGGTIFRIGANQFERFLYTLPERRVI